MFFRPAPLSPHIPNEDEIRDFCYAARDGDMTIVALMLTTYGGNIVNAPGDYQMTALCEAARSGHIDIMNLLLENGADINKPDGRMLRTPLGWAAFMGKEASIALLLDKKAEAHHRDSENRTAAELARWMGFHHSANLIETRTSEQLTRRAEQALIDQRLKMLRDQRPPNPFKKKGPPAP